ncbi:methyltransferase [Embleya sp. AB8]|uniref:methyltransferase n=1 Tax=Embleya sp. AB8 TaxID=3156304 RepID=UPI003C719CAA
MSARPVWNRVFADTPRRPYIPAVVWAGDDDARIDRTVDPDAWADAVAADIPLVTQVDDGTDVGHMIPTSSASMPSLVRLMLEQLDPRTDQNVLELGTGTGWSSALLSAALTEGSVTTVEVDEQVAGAARKTLKDHCRTTLPTMVVGDGLEGHKEGAPYHRLIATMAVRHVPYAWVEQTTSGGVIVTPWGNVYNNSGLLRLIVGDNGTASGRFVGNVNFMWARSQRSKFDGRRFVGDVISDPDTARIRHTLTDPRPLREEHADFAIGLRLPEVEHRTFFGRGDRAEEFTVWYADGESWAAIDYKPGVDSYEVNESGPRDLWREIEAAYDAWRAQGEPPREQHGVTVTRDGQWTWLDGPNGRVDIGPTRT